jgi:hypothetical protein
LQMTVVVDAQCVVNLSRPHHSHYNGAYSPTIVNAEIFCGRGY